MSSVVDVGQGTLWSGREPSGFWMAVAYSLQKLLPFVEVQKFEDIHLSSGVTLYFLAHRVVGYALAAFLAAGIAGLTQKS